MDYGVFLSYRRSDTSGHAGRIADDLARQFKRPVVFRDIDAIAVGSDFVEALESAIRNARVGVILIGDSWLAEHTADGSRRLDDPDDHVRREVAMALAEPSLKVVPVLVEGAQMPDEKDLPEDLQRLARLQAIELSENRWDYDMQRLAEVLAQAGVEPPVDARWPRWLRPVAGLVLVAALAATAWHWRVGTDSMADYTGLWYLPNGSFWTVREKDAALWVEETHYESQQVWKRGPGRIDSDGLHAALSLVFEKQPFRYLHKLQLSADRQSLIGGVRRSDQQQGQSLVLKRSAR